MSYANANERYFASLINQSRQAAGLGTLKLEKRLNDSADAHSRWMLDNNVFSHTGRGGSSPRQRMEAAEFDLAGRWMTAENLAYVSIRGESDLRDEIRQLHQNLLNSPGHYANIMGSTSVLGIGLQVGTMTVGGRDYRVLMATQNFADTDGLVRLDLGTFQRVALPSVKVAMQARADWLDSFNGKVFKAAADGTASNDDFRLGARHDSVSAGAGHDTLSGGGGNDRLSGGTGNDRLIGDTGADTLKGGAGNDTLQGGAGNDALLGEDGNDMLRGDAGQDRIWGGAGADLLIGGDGLDTLSGDGGNDWLAGDGQNDRLLGGDGNDTLHGGAGNDLLNGGAGADTFLFARGGGTDTIQAYEHGIDRLLIPRTLLDADPAAFMRDHMTRSSAGVVIDLGGGDRIIVAGTTLTAAQVADDIFGY
ncbi:Hemolysin, chromosomal [Paracoccus haematequi]|uniref:Hemolysin, chromosomal n=1 Tax=Paracoccus haematequi TaxID=2491866 RepID=A0A447IJY0_9RHOB|nr:CAP domain-containing protein [Paracoccus haematequi]VDS07801.1 Hemolysin, chromosomal [Paracoccus haematequi]